MTRAPVTKDDNPGPGPVPTQPDGSSHLLSPRLGRAEPPALNSSFSLPERTTRALDTKVRQSPRLGPASGGKSFTDTRPGGLLPGSCRVELPTRVPGLCVSTQSIGHNAR